MPEGPELHLSAKYINTVCKGRKFAGKVIKSDVNKNPEIDWNETLYSISASSKGKELQLTLSALELDAKHDDKRGKQRPTQETKISKGNKCMKIVFNFGMSGRFNFFETAETVKHSHLNFFTSDRRPWMTLSFVDPRRFGRWRVANNWASDRGPCIILEYQKFRQNVLERLNDLAFNKPICETLLNQKFFNGVGNYLRAEILYRAGVRPFDEARGVFQGLVGNDDLKIEKGKTDILQLCNQLSLEVTQLGSTVYNPSPDEDYSKFTAWLQCYYNPGMNNLMDHNKRRVWFKGDPGPMVPKEIKAKGMKRCSKNQDDNDEATHGEFPNKKKSKKKMTADKTIKHKGKQQSGTKIQKISVNKRTQSRVTRATLKTESSSLPAQNCVNSAEINMKKKTKIRVKSKPVTVLIKHVKQE